MNIIKNLKVCYTLSERTPTTINNSTKSLRKAGIDNMIFIYAEPGEYLLLDKSFYLINNPEKLGCFKNFNQVVTDFIEEEEEEYLLLIQDDYLIRNNSLGTFRKEIKRIIKEGGEFGYYNFILHRLNKGDIKKSGWNEYPRGYDLSGACFLFQRETLKQIVNSEFYQNHYKTKDKNLDACIGEATKRLGLKGYIPSESFIVHSGHSTIGHTDIYLNQIIEKKF